MQNQIIKALAGSIIESSEDAIISKNLDGIITSWNHGAENIFGYSPDEAMGKGISLIIPPDRIGEEIEIIQKISEGKHVKHYETERVRKDGTLVQISLTVSPIKNEEGEIIGASKIARDITARVEAGKKLIASEKRFHNTLDNMLEGIQMHNFNWEYIYVNDTLVSYSHYSKVELLGHTLMERYPGIEETDLFKALKRCMDLRIPQQLETEFIFPDGTRTDFELSVQPIPEGIFILSFDITERKKAKEKILKANRLYSFLSSINQSIVHIATEGALLENVGLIATSIGQFKSSWIGLLDKQGKLNLVSIHGDPDIAKEIQKFSGLDYGSPELAQTTMGEVLKTGKYVVKNDVRNDPSMKAFREKFIQLGIKSTISLPITTFSRIIGVFGLHSQTQDYFDQEEIALLHEAASDISFALENFEKEKQHRQAEVLVAQNESRLKKAQSIAHLGHWEINFATGIALWSDESCRIYGLDATDNKQTFESWASFIHPDDRDSVLKLITEQRETLSDLSFDHRIVRQDGTVRYIHTESKVEYDSLGIQNLVYGISLDVTEEKISEMEREKIISDIVQRNKDLEQFSYIVSHNLRLPVANIMGLSTAALNENLDRDSRKEVMEGLSYSVSKLDEVIIDLNNILKVKLQVNEMKEKIAFSGLALDIHSSIINLIQKENAVMTWDFSEIDEMVTIKSYLYSIFYNLISNSLKYRKTGISPVIQIKSRKLKDKIELIFKDNGIGIDLEKEKKHVFGLYKRFHPEQAEGKGMGLYMVKTQAECIGGKISIMSAINEGTELKIEFPY